MMESFSVTADQESSLDLNMTNDSKASSLKDDFYLPKIKKIQINEEWSLSLDEQFLSCILSENKIDSSVLESLLPLINLNRNKDFKYFFSFKTVPFSAYFFQDLKTVFLTSPKLHYELFLLKLIQNSNFEKPLESLPFLDLIHRAKKVLETDGPSDFEISEKNSTLSPLDLELFKKTEDQAQGLTQELLFHMNSYQSSLFEKITDWGLSLCTEYDILRVHLLKFLAILPSLDHDKEGGEVKKRFLESLRRILIDSKKAKSLSIKSPPRKILGAINITYSLASLIPNFLLANAIRRAVKTFAKRFIAGESIVKAKKAFQDIFSTGRDLTLDRLGELVVSDKEADLYLENVLELIKGLSLHVSSGERNKANILKAHVSIKVSALCRDFCPESYDYTYSQISERLKKILLTAKNEKVFINIDAEHYHYRDTVFQIYSDVLLKTPELYDYADTGIVVQAYLRDAPNHFLDVLNLAKKRQILMPVRLVKGAYWDIETIEAEVHGHLAPEFLNKEETDLCFRKLIKEFFENHQFVQLCLASHNYSDHCFAETLRKENFPNIWKIEHQCLHMTYEGLSKSLATMGFCVRNYVPIGGLLVGMAYLVRRIMENSSQVGVLAIMRSHKNKKRIVPSWEIHQDKIDQNEKKTHDLLSQNEQEFFNTPTVRTYLHSERKWVDHSYQKLKMELPLKVSDSYCSGEIHKVYSGSYPNLLVGEITFATIEDTKKALNILEKSFYENSWTSWKLSTRSSILLKAAQMMLAQRCSLASLIVLEANKTFKEALADVDEAIDFINFYTRNSSIKNIPRGPVAVIAPWNFPLAIPCGMVVGGLASGSPVILKSAEQTPLIASQMVNLFHQAGVPEDALIHLPGLGESVGEELVKSSKIATYVFTGSKNVGTKIFQIASQRFFHNSQLQITYPVKVCAEMGGKNGVIVTPSAELDETVSGILQSAFGHAGQKCSALSRIFVHFSVRDRLVERLKEAIADLKIGSSDDWSVKINPLISDEEKQRVQKQVHQAIDEVKRFKGQVHIDRSQEQFLSFCVGPVLLELPLERAKNSESFAQKELFAPVIHLFSYENETEMIQVFNSTDYALTSGIFSQSQDEIDYLSDQIHAGNIYVNRNITGARVAIEPFGGFKSSGTGPKAGSKDYLGHFFINKVDIPAPHGTLSSNGGHYLCDLSSPSTLELSSRMKKIQDALAELIQYESIFFGHEGDFKKLNNLKSWTEKSFLKTVFNKKIPGQLSYDDLNLIHQNIIVVSTREKICIETFFQFMAAISLGAGVTILALNEKSYTWWGQVIQFFHRSGISRDNLDVYFNTSKKLKETLQLSDIDSIIFDDDPSLFQDLWKQMLEGPDGHLKKLRKMILLYDSPLEVDDFQFYLNLFVYKRSFAVNTIRYSAPLEIGSLS